MGRVTAPELGDRVAVEYAFKEGTYEGVVIELLSTQFVFLCDDETVHYCFHNGDWKNVKES